jgi:hypothetical protein
VETRKPRRAGAGVRIADCLMRCVCCQAGKRHRNIEIGLLFRDRALAASVSSHFRALIDRSLLRPLPMA